MAKPGNESFTESLLQLDAYFEPGVRKLEEFLETDLPEWKVHRK